jgi:hypothetical protein
VCLFWAALTRPERIRSLMEFRLAALILGVSIVAPVLVQLFVIGRPVAAGGRPPVANQAVELSMYAMAIPPVLTMLAVILGIDSVMPRPKGPGDSSVRDG